MLPLQFGFLNTSAKKDEDEERASDEWGSSQLRMQQRGTIGERKKVVCV
jgi:hypothetical protein